MTTSTDTGVLTDVCDFPVTFQSTQTLTLTLFSDSSGTVTRASGHLVEQDVFSANSKSLTSSTYTTQLSAPVDSNGDFGEITANGVEVRVPLPDGGVFLTAGHDVRVRTGPLLFTQKGAVVNLAGFCAALAP